MTDPSTSTGTMVREATPADLADVVKLLSARDNQPRDRQVVSDYLWGLDPECTRAWLAYVGDDLQVRLGQFNSYVQEVLDRNSTLYQDPTDVVVLAVQTHDVAPELWTRSTELEASQLDSVVEHVLQARK